jgi:hypothetical protein
VFGGGCCHVYIMDSVSDEVLAAFVADMAESAAAAASGPPACPNGSE